MTNSYKIEIKYAETEDVNEFVLHEDGSLHFTVESPIPLKRPSFILQHLYRLAEWLKENGGTSISIVEEES